MLTCKVVPAPPSVKDNPVPAVKARAWVRPDVEPVVRNG
jgi:hypothetical protein